MLVFAHDKFFGDLQFSRSLNGMTLSHLTANAPPDTVETHTHSDAHFVLITSGEYVSSAKREANRHTTLIYNPPGTTHRDHFQQGGGSFFTISLSDARLAQSADTVLQPVAMHVREDRACGLGLALLMECARWDSCSSLKAESLSAELLFMVSEHGRRPEKTCPPWLREASELIQDSHKESLKINEIAKSIGVHPTHLARAFRRFYGCTPGDLLRARRLAKAASLLLRSIRSIADIALESGFSDQSQFTKAFSRTYGIAPGVFRERSGRTALRRNVAF